MYILFSLSGIGKSDAGNRRVAVVDDIPPGEGIGCIANEPINFILRDPNGTMDGIGSILHRCPFLLDRKCGLAIFWFDFSRKVVVLVVGVDSSEPNFVFKFVLSCDIDEFNIDFNVIAIWI